MGSLTDDLEPRLNRAAEAAVPKASKLCGSAIQQITIDDAKANLTDYVLEKEMAGVFCISGGKKPLFAKTPPSARPNC